MNRNSRGGLSKAQPERCWNFQQQMSEVTSVILPDQAKMSDSWLLTQLLEAPTPRETDHSARAAGRLGTSRDFGGCSVNDDIRAYKEIGDEANFIYFGHLAKSVREDQVLEPPTPDRLTYCMPAVGTSNTPFMVEEGCCWKFQHLPN